MSTNNFAERIQFSNATRGKSKCNNNFAEWIQFVNTTRGNPWYINNRAEMCTFFLQRVGIFLDTSGCAESVQIYYKTRTNYSATNMFAERIYLWNDTYKCVKKQDNVILWIPMIHLDVDPLTHRRHSSHATRGQDYKKKNFEFYFLMRCRCAFSGAWCVVKRNTALRCALCSWLIRSVCFGVCWC